MDILKVAVELLGNYFGDKVDDSALGSAAKGLFGGAGGDIYLAGLVSKVSGSGGLQSLVGSWLGDGANQALDPAQILSIFGGDKVSAFAGELGIGQDQAAGGLAAVIPQLIDRFSKGGALLDPGEGLGGMLNMARKLF
ncbi:MAG: YidB family protein [Zavarzinia sp.]|nr:YidB family protein [Zavarzinia sp.]